MQKDIKDAFENIQYIAESIGDSMEFSKSMGNLTIDDIKYIYKDIKKDINDIHVNMKAILDVLELIN